MTLATMPPLIRRRVDELPPPLQGCGQRAARRSCCCYLLTSVRLHRTVFNMEIRSVKHRGLSQFIEDNNGRGIRQDLLNRVRNILTVLIVAPNMDAITGPPGWRIHQLTGDRRGTWSISVSVSSNWRITFD